MIGGRTGQVGVRGDLRDVGEAGQIERHVGLALDEVEAAAAAVVDVITLSFPPSETLTADAFNAFKAQIDAAGPQIQAFAVASDWQSTVRDMSSETVY